MIVVYKIFFQILSAEQSAKTSNLEVQKIVFRHSQAHP